MCDSRPDAYDKRELCWDDVEMQNDALLARFIPETSMLVLTAAQNVPQCAFSIPQTIWRIFRGGQVWTKCRF